MKKELKLPLWKFMVMLVSLVLVSVIITTRVTSAGGAGSALPISKGGTGATSQAGAQTNLQIPKQVSINGSVVGTGTVDANGNISISTSNDNWLPYTQTISFMTDDGAKAGYVIPLIKVVNNVSSTSASSPKGEVKLRYNRNGTMNSAMDMWGEIIIRFNYTYGNKISIYALSTYTSVGLDVYLGTCKKGDDYYFCIISSSIANSTNPGSLMNTTVSVTYSSSITTTHPFYTSISNTCYPKASCTGYSILSASTFSTAGDGDAGSTNPVWKIPTNDDIYSSTSQSAKIPRKKNTTLTPNVPSS